MSVGQASVGYLVEAAVASDALGLGASVAGRRASDTFVATLNFHPNGNLLATGDADKLVSLWDFADDWAISLCRLTGPTGDVVAVRINTDGTRLAAACTDGNIWVWSVTDGVEFTHFATIDTGRLPLGAHNISFDPTQPVLTSSGANRLIDRWPLEPDGSSDLITDRFGNGLAQGDLDRFQTTVPPEPQRTGFRPIPDVGSCPCETLAVRSETGRSIPAVGGGSDMGNSAANGSTGSSDDESAGKLVVGAAAEIGRSVLRWSAPLLVLGAIGMITVNAGSSESTGAFGQTNTDLSGVGIAGAGFLALAVAVFFGRGSFAGLLDVLFVETILFSSLIAIGATLLGVFHIASGFSPRVDMFTLSADCWNPR